jgi:hypothetical protein
MSVPSKLVLDDAIDVTDATDATEAIEPMVSAPLVLTSNLASDLASNLDWEWDCAPGSFFVGVRLRLARWCGCECEFECEFECGAVEGRRSRVKRAFIPIPAFGPRVAVLIAAGDDIVFEWEIETRVASDGANDAAEGDFEGVVELRPAEMLGTDACERAKAGPAGVDGADAVFGTGIPELDPLEARGRSAGLFLNADLLGGGGNLGATRVRFGVDVGEGADAAANICAG